MLPRAYAEHRAARESGHLRNGKGADVPRRVIDLSQPLNRESQVHPFFTTPKIVRELIHADSPADRPSFNAELIITSNHAATHVDAFGHYDRSEGAAAIAEMPLDTFCGPAVCIDVREYGGKGHEVTPGEVEDALGKSEVEVERGDILLFCTDHFNQTAGTPAFLDGFSGVAPETVGWMAEQGIKIFGVETISPDLVYENGEYRTHRACAEHGITHYENLNNLREVAGHRFDFYGFPLRLEVAYGSPVRAVGIIEE
jgi:kynurenine formamidase